jgi:Tfp pilus assembly protein PilV
VNGIRSHHRSGFLLLEALVALAVFALFLTAVGVAMISSAKSSAAAGDRARGAMLTQAAIGGVQNIRDASFASLTAGSHGVRLGSGALGLRWMFDGASTKTSDGFTTTVLIESLSSTRVRATARTWWNFKAGRSGSVVAIQELTDWKAGKTIGNWATPTLKGTYTAPGTALFNDVALTGNYAFASSEISSGGKGLYVIDVSNPAAPTRVASAFDLGVAGRQMALYGTTLYIVPGSSTQEIRAYDVSSPSTFSSSNLVASYNLPGSARGLSLAIVGTKLVVGAAYDTTEKELYVFNIATPSAITLLGSQDTDGSVNGLAVRGTNVLYLANSADIAELRVGDIANPASPRLPSGSGYNLTDVLDGTSVAVAGTGVVLGRMSSSSIEELVLFDVQAKSVPSTPGPWYFNTANTVNAIEADPSGRYVFVASDGTTKQLRVVDLWKWETAGVPEKGYYTVGAGNGRGLAYDAWKDRVYLVTNTAFLVLAAN